MRDINSIKSEVITLKNSLEVMVNRWGNRHNTSILFLHGLGSTGKSFAELAANLSSHFHILAVDLPGHGGSSFMSEEKFFSMESLADWVKEIIEYYNLIDFHIVGHSLGGYVSLAFINRYHAQSVVLLDGGYIKSSSLPGNCLEDEIRMTQKHIDNYMFPSWEEYEQGLNKNGLSPESIEMAKNSMKRTDNGIKLKVNPEAAINFTKQLFEEPTATALTNITSSVLLLRSTLPETMNAIRDTAVKQLKENINLEVINVSEASHEIYWDQPEKVAMLIKRWILNEKGKKHL